MTALAIILGTVAGLAIAACIILGLTLRKSFADVKVMAGAMIESGKAQVAAERSTLLVQRARDNETANRIKAEDERDTARAQLALAQIRIQQAAEKEGTRVAESIGTAADPISVFNLVLQGTSVPDVPGGDATDTAAGDDHSDANDAAVQPTGEDDAPGDGGLQGGH